MSAAPRAVVVGAGAYGLACATRLAEAGARVQVLERYEPAHPWAASGGTTRVLRYEYGAARRYTAMTVQAADAWRALERRFGETLFVQCGVLHLARGKDEWDRESLAAVHDAGMPLDELSVDEVARRWPAFAVDDVGCAMFSPRGGYVFSRRATARLADVARASGVELHSGVEAREVGGGRVRTAHGETFEADVVVVCAGSWSSALDRRLDVVVPRRQVTAYFDRDVGAMPVFGDVGLSHYGFPHVEGMGVKIGWHNTLEGEVADPADPTRREATDEDVEALRRFVAQRLPSLADAPATCAEVCFYAMTADEDPVIDWLDERTLACCGLSGHGFKFSAVLGRAVGELALGLEPSVDLRGFELDRPALRAAS